MPLLKPVHPTTVFSSFNGFSSSIYSAVQHQSSPCSGAGQEASSPSAPPGAAWSVPIGTTGIVLVLGGTAGAVICSEFRAGGLKAVPLPTPAASFLGVRGMGSSGVVSAMGGVG